MKKLILFVICATNLCVAIAQPGLLDTSFYHSGKRLFGISKYSSNNCRSVGVQSDGKILIAGFSSYGSGFYFTIARLYPDGMPDTLFGDHGFILTEVGKADDRAYSMVVLSDDKFIVGGGSADKFAYNFGIAKYLKNGQPDSTFGINGIVTTNIDSLSDEILSLAIQSDGKIIAAGYKGNYPNQDWALARYNNNGTLDTSFGNNGIFVFDNNNNTERIKAVAIQNDGKMIIVGETSNSTYVYSCLIARINANGTIDRTFGDNGIVTVDGYIPNGVSVQTDNKIVVAGEPVWFKKIFLLRLDNNGTQDITFGNNGIVITDIDSSAREIATSILLQPDGKIVIAGYSTNNFKRNFLIARYNASGILDNSFDNDGVQTTNIDSNSSDYAYSLAMQPDGKFLVAGTSHINSRPYFSIARYISGIINSIEIDKPQNKNITITVYPNPVKKLFNIEYQLNKSDRITIYLTDFSGQIIQTLIENEKQQKGKHNELLKFPENLSSGCYFLFLTRSNKISSSKIIFINY